MIIGYIDPGSGSILIQLLAGVIVGTLFVIKLYWQRFKRMMIELYRFITLRFK